MKKYCLIFLLFNPAFVSAAEELELPAALPQSDQTGFWGLQFENDFLGGGSLTDRYYTQGIELSYAKPGVTPEWLLFMAQLIPLYESGSNHGVSYSLGHKIFTPANISASTLQVDDRPYAAYLYTTFSYANSVDLNSNLQHVNVIELTVGVVGPTARGEELQNFFHDLVGAPIAQGWQYQLNNELGLGLGYIHKWRLFEPSIGSTQIEVSPHTSMVLGNVYTYIAGGVMFRWGKGLKRDMGPPNIRPGFIGSTYFVPRFEPNWYFFLGHETRLVLRDIFLDGNTFSESHRVDKELIVGDLQLGYAFHQGNFRIAASMVVRSKEFTTQSHYFRYGCINLTYYFQRD